MTCTEVDKYKKRYIRDRPLPGRRTAVPGRVLRIVRAVPCAADGFSETHNLYRNANEPFPPGRTTRTGSAQALRQVPSDQPVSRRGAPVGFWQDQQEERQAYPVCERASRRRRCLHLLLPGQETPQPLIHVIVPQRPGLSSGEGIPVASSNMRLPAKIGCCCDLSVFNSFFCPFICSTFRFSRIHAWCSRGCLL